MNQEMPPDHYKRYIMLIANRIILHNNIMWYKTDNKYVLALPRRYAYSIINETHSSLIGGHRNSLTTKMSAKNLVKLYNLLNKTVCL